MASNCEKCGGSEGEQFTFYYGNKVKEHQQFLPNNMVRRTTTYDVAGSLTVTLCKACVRKDLLYKVLFCTAFSLGSGVITYLIWMYAPMSGSNLSLFQHAAILMSWVAFLFCACGSCLVLGFGMWALIGPRGWGETAAIDFRTAELMKSGYDEFWTTTEFDALQK